MKGIIGKKIGMTQVYDAMGRLIPVTVVEAGPCVVTALRTQERDGYSAVQVGFGSKKAKNTPKPMQGHFAKAGIKDVYPATVTEFRTETDSELELGSTLTVEIFNDVKFVDVAGTTKGRGFQGVVKRYNFAGGRASHGGDWLRKPGSIGMCEFPGKVMKGKKMPGQMGDKRRTTQNIEVIGVRPADNVLLLKGAVPGSKGGTLYISKAIKK